jgi:polysaccharide export outer membrane protein
MLTKLHKPLTVFALIVPFVLLLTSCGVPKNFQNAVYLKDSVTDAQKVVVNKPAVIRPGDRLSINVTAVNKEAAEAFNATGGTTTGAENVEGYLVDSLGNIQLLQLGVMHVAGLTTAQMQQNLQQQLAAYIVGPVVTVNISNFKINVMGEVTRPGTIIVPDGKMNILEALTQSGDLTIFAKRDNILIIREQDGKREFGRLDISSNKIFESPYYNLQQNDFIYVEPDKTKFIANDFITNRNVRNLSIFITLLTTITLIYSLTKL